MRALPARKRLPVVVTIRDVDVTRIVPGLYQGGVQAFEGKTNAITLRGIDMAVMLAPDANVRVFTPEMYEYALEDHWSDLEHLSNLDRIAKMAARRVKSGKRVAVFCRQGRNRSGLVTALTLRHLRPDWSGRKIVRHIQDRRPEALGNEAFEEYLKALPPRGFPRGR